MPLKMKLGTALGTLLLVLLAAFSASAQGADAALVRFVHVVPGAQPIDVLIDGQLAVVGLSYGVASVPINLPAGDHVVAAAAGGAVLWEQPLAAPSGSAITLIASSTDPLTFTPFFQDINPVEWGKARFTAIHAIADAPAVDVLLADGRAVSPGLTYDTPYGMIDLPSLGYDIEVRLAGEETVVVPVARYNLFSGTMTSLLLYGTAAAPEVMLVSIPTRPAEPTYGTIRFAHVASQADAVELLIDGSTVVPSLAFGASTDFVRLPAGTYTAAARQADASEAVAENEFTLDEGQTISLLIGADADGPRIYEFNEAVADITAETALVSTLNLAAEGVLVTTTAGDLPLATDLAYTESAFSPVAPTVDGLSAAFVAGETTSAQDFTEVIYGGTLTSLVAVADGDSVAIVRLAPAALAVGLGSTPGFTAAQAEQAVEATPVAPVETPAPAAGATTASPTATILLNPGANLQLRLYPSADAQSLGLAPASSTLIVNGRAGAPTAAPGAEATPAPDPAAGLARNEDLNPADTWLYISYSTPDGGTINAWVNALYLSVTSTRGDAQRLADLPTVPSNRAGAALGTAITAPEGPDRTVYAFTGNVAAGTRVHVRRLPEVTAESLALVGGETRLTWLGTTSAQDWHYVRFDDNGTVFVGWVSALYVTTFERQGRAVDLEELQSRGELVTLTGEERGGIEEGAAPTATLDPSLRNVIIGEVININAGSNLHLRRFDNSASESLALIPSATTFTVAGRTADGVWLRVDFDGQTGWVASQYVRLTRNGRAFELADVPVVGGAASTLSSTGNAAAPSGSVAGGAITDAVSSGTAPGEDPFGLNGP